MQWNQRVEKLERKQVAGWAGAGCGCGGVQIQVVRLTAEGEKCKISCYKNIQLRVTVTVSKMFLTLQSAADEETNNEK